MERNTRLYQERYFRAQERPISNSALDVYLSFFHERSVFCPTDRTLEIGTSNGSILRKLKTRYPNLYGLDINAHALQSGNYRDPTLRLIQADATQLPFADGSFDVVFSIHTLEHISDIQKVMEEIDRVLVEGGRSMHIFPKFNRHLTALPDAIRMHPFNPIKAWKTAGQLHVHNITPDFADKITANTQLLMVNYEEFQRFGIPISRGMIHVKSTHHK